MRELVLVFVAAHGFMALIVVAPIALGSMSRSAHPLLAWSGRLLGGLWMLGQFQFRFVLPWFVNESFIRNATSHPWMIVPVGCLAVAGLWVAFDIVRGGQRRAGVAKP